MSTDTPEHVHDWAPCYDRGPNQYDCKTCPATGYRHEFRKGGIRAHKEPRQRQGEGGVPVTPLAHGPRHSVGRNLPGSY